MAGGSRSFHLLSWALANVPSLFAWGLPSVFPSCLAMVRRCSYAVPLLPALYPHKALPMPTLPVNCRGLLQGYARHCSPGGAEQLQNELGVQGASDQQLQQAAKGVQMDGGCWHCRASSWGGSVLSICTWGNAHPETSSGRLSKSQRGPGCGTPMWVTPREAAAHPRSLPLHTVPRCFLHSALN